MAGWMMAQLAGTDDSAAVFRYTVHYSLFGLFWLAFIIATISQFAINDGNYYESVNAGQNLIGGWRRWRRIYTCVLIAGGGVIAADLVNFHFLNGWFKVATFLAVTVPSATVIMAVDHFLLPRIYRISRPLTAGSVVGGRGAAQLACDGRPARRRLLRRHRHGELAERLAAGGAVELVGPRPARGMGDRGCRLHRARRRSRARSGLCDRSSASRSTSVTTRSQQMPYSTSPARAAS